MTKKNYLRAVLVLAIFCMALCGWLLHLRIHPFTEHIKNAIPFVAGCISVFVIPVLFLFRPTIPFAYLLNGMTVIVGTIAMTEFSLKNPPSEWSLQTILFGTLLADVIMLWGKFAVGHALFHLESTVNHPDAPTSKGRFFRFPNMGFWLVHLVVLTIVYTIGTCLLK